MIDVEEEYQKLLKELGEDANRMPKNLRRLFYMQGVLTGIQLLDSVQKLQEKGDS